MANENWQGTYFAIEASAISWMSVAAQLHLAILHPKNQGPNKDIAIEWIRLIMNELIKAGFEIPEAILRSFEQDVGPLDRPITIEMQVKVMRQIDR